MMAIVLAGGQGVRLRPLTYAIPKPLLPVDEKPILEVIIERLKAHGFEQLILAVGYRAELIETYFRDGSPFGVRISYVREAEPLGTAGPLALVRREYPHDLQEPVLVMNGDVLTNVDFRDLLRCHAAGGWEMIIVARPFQAQLPYGVLTLDGARVLDLVEKPTQVHQVSAGIYVLQPAVLDLVPDNTQLDMPDLVARLLADGRAVGAYPFDGEWIAVDRVEQLEEARRQMVEGER